MLAEKFARGRLRALARVDGKVSDGKPTVLFLCVHNAGRSAPGDQVSSAAIAAMKERSIDISGEYPKPWTDEIVQAADVVITMGCGDACPVFPGKRYEEWVLEDPANWDAAGIRPIRDDIERRVLNLLDELEVPAVQR
jgi:protein-tyrosine-phosphatase